MRNNFSAEAVAVGAQLEIINKLISSYEDKRVKNTTLTSNADALAITPEPSTDKWNDDGDIISTNPVVPKKPVQSRHSPHSEEYWKTLLESLKNISAHINAQDHIFNYTQKFIINVRNKMEEMLTEIDKYQLLEGDLEAKNKQLKTAKLSINKFYDSFKFKDVKLMALVSAAIGAAIGLLIAGVLGAAFGYKTGAIAGAALGGIAGATAAFFSNRPKQELHPLVIKARAGALNLLPDETPLHLFSANDSNHGTKSPTR